MARPRKPRRKTINKSVTSPRPIVLKSSAPGIRRRFVRFSFLAMNSVTGFLAMNSETGFLVTLREDDD